MWTHFISMSFFCVTCALRTVLSSEFKVPTQKIHKQQWDIQLIM